jgi:hypothetical protein
MTGNSAWPEIIEPCEEEMRLQCGESRTCALVVGVGGLTAGKESSYRLKGFYGLNKLKLDTPKPVPTFVSGTDYRYDYYWFVITDAVADPAVKFEYQVSVAAEGNFDPDLFVSLLDGRSPTAEDYDLASTMEGADTIRISSEAPYWEERGWPKQAGVVVVVGVRYATAGTYTLVLTSPETQQ